MLRMKLARLVLASLYFLTREVVSGEEVTVVIDPCMETEPVDEIPVKTCLELVH